MKITAVDSFLMSCPLPEPLRLPFWGGERIILKRDAMYVRISTDAGLRGYAPGPADLHAHRTIQEEIGPFLEGKDPRRWRDFDFRGSAASVKVYGADSREDRQKVNRDPQAARPRRPGVCERGSVNPRGEQSAHRGSGEPQPTRRS